MQFYYSFSTPIILFASRSISTLIPSSPKMKLGYVEDVEKVRWNQPIRPPLEAALFVLEVLGVVGGS